MGLFDSPAVTWSLVSLDKGTKLEGQFEPQNLTENVGGVWASEGTIGLDQPILQFIRGEQETISCDVKIWAKHHGLFGFGKGDNISETRDKIRDLARRDSDLGRPHIYLFSVGEEFSQQVVVKSVGGIRYDRMRPKDGSLRGVLFHLEMLRYVEYDTTSLLSANVAESLVIPAKDGDDYEGIAQRMYGDARLGEVLRRRNPDKRVIVVGDLIHIPPANRVRSELSLTPASLFLKDAPAQASVFNDVLALRSQSKRSIPMDASRHGNRALLTRFADRFPGMVLHLDARFVTRDGDDVLAMLDQSGSGNDCDVPIGGSAFPVFETDLGQGYPGVVFSSASSGLSTASQFSFQDVTMLAIFADQAGAGSGRIVSHGESAFGVWIGTDSSFGWNAGVNDAVGQSVGSNGIDVFGAQGIRRTVDKHDALATWDLYDSTGILHTKTDDGAIAATSTICIGSDNGDADHVDGVALIWLGVWNRALTAAEYRAVYIELQNRYNLD